MKIKNCKLLIISGPTATGKTALAIKLAKIYNGELISADSRQIYQGLDIGTGKDHLPDVKIHLVDIIKPNQSFSVVQYQTQALAIIADIHFRHKLPIIVGGTGQYIDSIVNPHKDTFSIKPIPVLRFFLNKFPLTALQYIYKVLDPNGYKNLNNSEVHNPHRLIRKIEIKLSFPKIKNLKLKIKNYSILHLSLTAPNEFIYQSIDQRVQNRLKMGLINEIKNILKFYKWSDPGLNTLAYKEFRPYFIETHNYASLSNKSVRTHHDAFQPNDLLDKAITNWKFDEHAYARRQKTWFKKMSPINFFDITQPDYLDYIFIKVKKYLETS